jgi:GntR family transcriptional regulator
MAEGPISPGYAGPKYAHIENTLRQRIEDGTYPPGTALPSENRLAAEFGTCRTTVLRALQALKHDGWVESQQGRANSVRGRPAARRTTPEHAKAAFNDPTVPFSVDAVLADAQVAAQLNIAEGTPVYRRSHHTTRPDALVTTFIPLDVAAGTDVTKPNPITDGVLAHLATRKNLRGDHAVESTTARHPTPEEADLLNIDKDTAVLAVTITAYTAPGKPILTTTLVLPGGPNAVKATYPL